MKLVIGCPIKDRAWILPEWFEAIENQELAPDVEITVMCCLSPSTDDTEQILRAHNVYLMVDPDPGRRETDIDTHTWGTPDTYQYMAALRNKLLEAVITTFHPDYFFSLDSDVILPSGGLQKLLSFAETHQGIIAPAVSMVPSGTAWNVMNWTDRDHPQTAHRPASQPSMNPVDVVMAAVLMDTEGMTCRWACHAQGEDLGLCLDAWDKKVRCWWVPTVKCDHVMVRR